MQPVASYRIRLTLGLITTLLAAVAVGAPSDDAAAEGASVSAKWVPRKLHYVYQGFTAHYSCDGLQEQVKQILQKLGASDLNVRRSGCTRLEGPEPFPGVNATFSVLEPATVAAKGAANSQEVAARWETVTLDASTPTRDNAGGCELIEQVKKEFLPLFATRNLQFSSDCFPHTASLVGAHLSVEVLRPVKPPPPPSAAH
jgi:hypothetical protein